MNPLGPVKEHSLNTPEVYNILINALAYLTEDTIHRLFDAPDDLRAYKGGRPLVMLQNGKVYEYHIEGTKPVDNDKVVSADGQPNGGQWWRLFTINLDQLVSEANLTNPAYEILGPAVFVVGPDGNPVIRFTTHEREANYGIINAGNAFLSILGDRLVDNITMGALQKLCNKLPCKSSGGTTNPTNTTLSPGFIGCIDIPDNSSPIVATAAEIRAWSGQLPVSFYLSHKIQHGYFVRDNSSVKADDDGMTIVATGGVRYSRLWDRITLEARFFPGARFDGNWTVIKNGAILENPTSADWSDNDYGDEKAINLALGYTKTLTETLGGLYHTTVGVPSGQLMVRHPINMTGFNGVTLRCTGNRYIGTVITGNTSKVDGSGSGIIIDCANSSHAFVEGVHLTASTTWGNICSKIGILFALGQGPDGGQQNGLNCGVRNIFIGGENCDRPTINGGAGFIGILNIRSEECGYTDFNIKANSPLIFSNAANLTDIGYNYTVTSEYVTLMPGYGSMGNINCSAGGNSLFVVQSRTPAIALNGTNSFNYIGYIGHVSYSQGSYQAAIKTRQSCLNPVVHTTVETFGSMLDSFGPLDNPDLKFTTSYLRQASDGSLLIPTAPLFLFNGIQWRGDQIGVNFGNPVTDLASPLRYLLYHDSVNNDNSILDPATLIQNCTLNAPGWINPYRSVSQNLMTKVGGEVVFRTGQPFKRVGTWTSLLFDYGIPAGTLAAPPSGFQIGAFMLCNRGTFNSNNAGGYRIRGRGEIVIGNNQSLVTNIKGFHYSISVVQNNSGQPATPIITLTQEEALNTNPDYTNIGNLAMGLDFATVNGYDVCRILFAASVSGSATTEPIFIYHNFEVWSDLFKTKGTLLIG